MRRHFRERMDALAKKAENNCAAERCPRCADQLYAAKAHLGRLADGWTAETYLHDAVHYCNDPAIKEELRKLHADFDKARLTPVPKRGEAAGWTPAAAACAPEAG